MVSFTKMYFYFYSRSSMSFNPGLTHLLHVKPTWSFMSEINWLSWRFKAFPYSLMIFRTSIILSSQLRHKVLAQKVSLEISFPSVVSRLKEAFVLFRLCFWYILAQSIQISSFNLEKTNVFDCFHRIAPLKCRTCKWSHPPFGTKHKWKPCKPGKSTSRDLVARSSALLLKNQASDAKTFSPGILVRSTSGKSNSKHVHTSLEPNHLSILLPQNALNHSLVWVTFINSTLTQESFTHFSGPVQGWMCWRHKMSVNSNGCLFESFSYKRPIPHEAELYIIKIICILS